MPTTNQKIRLKGHRANVRRHYLIRDHRGTSPFVHGMAKVVDVGGILRETDVGVARRLHGRQLAVLKQPDTEVVAINKVMGTVGGYFQRVIGYPAKAIATAEGTSDESAG